MGAAEVVISFQQCAHCWQHTSEPVPFSVGGERVYTQPTSNAQERTLACHAGFARCMDIDLLQQAVAIVLHGLQRRRWDIERKGSSLFQRLALVQIQFCYGPYIAVPGISQL